MINITTSILILEQSIISILIPFVLVGFKLLAIRISNTIIFTKIQSQNRWFSTHLIKSPIFKQIFPLNISYLNLANWPSNLIVLNKNYQKPFQPLYLKIYIPFSAWPSVPMLIWFSCVAYRVLRTKSSTISLFISPARISCHYSKKCFWPYTPKRKLSMKVLSSMKLLIWKISSFCFIKIKNCITTSDFYALSCHRISTLSIIRIWLMKIVFKIKSC